MLKCWSSALEGDAMSTSHGFVWDFYYLRVILDIKLSLRQVSLITITYLVFANKIVPQTMWPVTSHVYKEPQAWTSCRQICTQPNGRNHKILYFMEIALSNSYQLLIWWKGAHLKTCPAFTFITLGFMWKLWHKMSTFPMTSAVLCLPEYSKNVQGHTYCKQSSHGL